MVGENALNERESLILQAIVQSYIATAEPVGSRTIVKRFGFDLSPATVRNVMADLEEAGYIQQVHTSSGRVPTDQGYRYYVDYLMRIQELTVAERSRIERDLAQKRDDANEVLHHASQLLALITHQTGVVKAPDESTAEVRHIEIVPVAAGRAAVLIADNFGRVHTFLIPMDTPPDEVGKLNNFLNAHLTGIALDKFAGSVQNVMLTLMDEQRRLAEHALQLVTLIPTNRPGKLYLEGTSMIFEQPEFRDMEKAREVFGVFEERDRLMGMLRSKVLEREREQPWVVIGSESQEPGLKEISVVASPYRVRDKSVGFLAVLGPRRMPYPKLTAIVDYTANLLGRFLTHIAG